MNGIDPERIPHMLLRCVSCVRAVTVPCTCAGSTALRCVCGVQVVTCLHTYGQPGGGDSIGHQRHCRLQENILTIDGDRAKEISHPQIKRAFQVYMSLLAHCSNAVVMTNKPIDQCHSWRKGLQATGVLGRRLTMIRSNISTRSVFMLVAEVRRLMQSLSYASRLSRMDTTSPALSFRKVISRAWSLRNRTACR